MLFDKQNARKHRIIPPLLNLPDHVSEETPSKEIWKVLQKRVREQACIYRISILDERAFQIEDLLSRAVEILREGVKYPEVAVASIWYDGRAYQTPGYKEKEWVLSSEIRVKDDISLRAKVAYLENRPLVDESVFLPEEQNLIDCVVTHLASKISHICSLKELEEKQKLLDKAYQLAHIGTWEFDMQTNNLYWSSATKEVHGFDQDYQPDLESTINLFKKGYNRETFRKAAMNAVEHQKPFDVELKIISGRGDERWIRATGEPEYVNGVCLRFYGISQDVTSRHKAEEDLQRSEQRFKSLVQHGSDLIAILDSEVNYTYVSPSVKSILGTPAEDYIGTNALDYIHEEDKGRITGILAGLSHGQRVNIPPFRFRDSKGNWRWIETTLTDMTNDPAVGGFVANSRDVTKQMQQQQLDLESLKEKEILLAEIHHRVKNNLAVVSGMMQLQALEEANKEIKDRLYDGISRIKTMANIHEQLYKSNSFSKLEFSDNIRSLVYSIQKTFQTKTKVNIHFNCELVQININQAIPCSLIMNEVVTNIFKHAFAGRDTGDIFINLTKCENSNNVLLYVRDNGIGLPDDVDTASGSSLGINLIDVLSQQLDADYTYVSDGEGTVFNIRFRKDEIRGIGNGFLK